MANRLVLCDPNIVRDGGHYLEYARMVLNAAARRGFQPILAVNEACRADIPEGWDVLPVFQYGFWGRKLRGEESSAPTFTEDDRSYLRLKYSSLGLLWAAAGDLGEFQHYNRSYPPTGRALDRIKSLSEIRPLVDLYLREDLARRNSTTPPEDWSAEERAQSYTALREAIRAALTSLKGKAPLERALASAAARNAILSDRQARDVGALQDLTDMAHKAAAFDQALCRVMESVRPTENDLFLYPTINYFELRGLKSVLDREPGAAAPSHHVILRRNVYSGYPGNFDSQEWDIHASRTALALLGDARRRTRIRFYTDTPALTHQYNLLGSTDFLTGPVPVDMVGRTRSGDAPSEDGDRRPTLIIYEAHDVQQARLFLEQLRAAAQDLSVPVVVNVVIRGEQCLYEFEVLGLDDHHGAVEVQFILPDQVDRIDADRFSTIVFGTWRDNYVRLALQAGERGRPVVVTANSWLARIRTRDARNFHDQALSDARTLSRAALPAASWNRYDFATGVSAAVAASDRLVVEDGAATTVDLAVATGADTVRLVMRRSPGVNSEGPLHLIAFFPSGEASGHSEGRHDLALVGGEDEDLSVVLPVPAGAARLSLSLCNFSQPAAIEIRAAEAVWLKAGRTVPALPGGLILPELVGDFRNSWITPLRNIEAAYASYARSAAEHLEPLELRKRILPPDRPLVLAYLGDAREEKGFHHLPDLMRATEADRTAPALILKSQVYYTSDYPEPACLTAAARLRSASRDRVTLIEGPLNSRDYARELLKSDAILIPYRRADYIARSSGIFSEALAGGIPVIVPTGTWMSAECDALTYGQHETLIARTDRTAMAQPAFHRLIGNQTAPMSAPSGRVPISRGALACAHFEIPDESDYIWITYRPDPSFRHVFTQFDISYQDNFENGHEIAMVKRVLGGSTASTFSLLARVPRAARAIWFGIYNAFGFEHYELRDFTITFVRRGGRPLPETAGGVVYFSSDDEAASRNELAAAVLRLKRDYGTYAASAEAIQPIWAQRHDPQRLIELLELPFPATEPSDHARFTGADW
ncbi:hypothetical protein ACLBYG_25920 [Methylobacterium sp. D53M]